MAIPPPSQPSSTPSSSGEGEPTEKSSRHKKDFNLPKKDKGGEGGKKKNLFDIAGSEQGVKELKQFVEQEQAAEVKKAGEIEASQAKASVTAVSQLIQRLVTEMKIGQIDGKDFASLKLSSSEAPQAFAGSNLTLSYQANGLIIHFDNFMTPQQENNAITLVEKNKEQLLDMMRALQSKNITVQEMTIGTHTVTLPRAEPLPPPFQPTQPGGAETRRDREQREGRGEEGAGPE